MATYGTKKTLHYNIPKRNVKRPIIFFLLMVICITAFTYTCSKAWFLAQQIKELQTGPTSNKQLKDITYNRLEMEMKELKHQVNSLIKISSSHHKQTLDQDDILKQLRALEAGSPKFIVYSEELKRFGERMNVIENSLGILEEQNKVFKHHAGTYIKDFTLELTELKKAQQLQNKEHVASVLEFQRDLSNKAEKEDVTTLKMFLDLYVQGFSSELNKLKELQDQDEQQIRLLASNLEHLQSKLVNRMKEEMAQIKDSPRPHYPMALDEFLMELDTSSSHAQEKVIAQLQPMQSLTDRSESQPESSVHREPHLMIDSITAVKRYVGQQSNTINDTLTNDKPLQVFNEDTRLKKSKQLMLGSITGVKEYFTSKVSRIVQSVKNSLKNTGSPVNPPFPMLGSITSVSLKNESKQSCAEIAGRSDNKCEALKEEDVLVRQNILFHAFYTSEDNMTITKPHFNDLMSKGEASPNKTRQHSVDYTQMSSYTRLNKERIHRYESNRSQDKEAILSALKKANEDSSHYNYRKQSFINTVKALLDNLMSRTIYISEIKQKDRLDQLQGLERLIHQLDLVLTQPSVLIPKDRDSLQKWMRHTYEPVKNNFARLLHFAAKNDKKISKRTDKLLLTKLRRFIQRLEVVKKSLDSLVNY